MITDNNKLEELQFWNDLMNKAQENFINKMYRPKFKELLSCLTNNQHTIIGQEKYEWSLIDNYKIHKDANKK